MMSVGRWRLGFAIFSILALLGAAALAFRTRPSYAGVPPGQVATEAEVARAWEEWSQSAHADTYDQGLGANTTCARCKSPLNWDPSQSLAAQEALDCYSCKRTPGAERPDLPGGVPVPQEDWQDIGCEVCHVPVGDSYSIKPSFWNRELQLYEPISDVTELCAKCHEGRHGFEVIEELEEAPAHNRWACTRCHGSHGSSSKCTDCHEPFSGRGAQVHAGHPMVNCSACHDAGGLTIWQESSPGSKHFGETITRRFAHALTSWPSHHLALAVACQRCHHPRDLLTPALVSDVSCESCHPEGAVLFWCTYFPRDPEPDVMQDKIR